MEEYSKHRNDLEESHHAACYIADDFGMCRPKRSREQHADPSRRAGRKEGSPAHATTLATTRTQGVLAPSRGSNDVAPKGEAEGERLEVEGERLGGVLVPPS